MENNSKDLVKLSFFSCVIMGIGSIIGANVFSATPIAIQIVGGNGIVLGYLLASVFVFLITVPEMVLTSSLPATGGPYMHLTRLVHPALGTVFEFNQLVEGPLMVAQMSLTFSTYFVMLFPNVNEVLVAVLITLIFTVISCFGIKTSAIVQNISVAILIIALGCYIFLGLGATKVSFQEVITTTVELTRLWAAMGIMHGSLMGANVLMYAAGEIKNPGKTVPLAFVVGTIFTAVVYALMSYVTVGVQPEWYNIDNLATTAGMFMGPAMKAFFITGGALLAVITSINSCMLMFSRLHFAAAGDGLYPAGIAKLNKYHVPANSLWFNSIIAILAIVSGFNLEDVINISSIPGLLLTPIVFVSVFYLPKKYPAAYKTCWFRFPHWLNCIIVVVAGALSFIMGSYVIEQMKPKNYLIMVAYYIVVAIYAFARNKYLVKTTGVSLFQRMRQPYEPWNEIEAAAEEKLKAAQAE